jgi:hypothetical protein
MTDRTADPAPAADPYADWEQVALTRSWLTPTGAVHQIANLFSCPTCSAVVPRDRRAAHHNWHEQS